MNIMLDIFLIIILVGFLIIIGCLVIPPIVSKTKIKKFINSNPEYVTMRIYSRSSSSNYQIRIFSVNGETPVFNTFRDFLYIATGKNKIIAKFRTQTESERFMPIAGAVLGGFVGLIIQLVHLSKTAKNDKELNLVNAIVIDIDIKRKGRYEMKADPENECINIIYLEDEKHELKIYKLQRPEA